LDFLSWHRYTEEQSPHELFKDAKIIRSILDDKGFTHTESHCNEWNLWGRAEAHPYNVNAKGAANTASSLIYMMHAGVDRAARYRGNIGPVIDSEYTNEGVGLFWDDGTYRKPAYAFKALSMMLKECPIQIEATGSDTEGYAVLAAKSADEEKIMILISDFQSQYTGYTLSIESLPWENFVYKRYVLDGDYNLEVIEKVTHTNKTSFSVTEQMSSPSIHLIEIYKFSPPLAPVKVYPNPCKLVKGIEKITFEFYEDWLIRAKIIMAIYNLRGKLIWRKEIYGRSSYKWDLKTSEGDPVPSGVYIYVITDDKGVIAKGKFAIIR
jgi:hypothetical protein